MASLFLDLAKKEGIEEKDLIFVNHVPPGTIPLYLRSFDICTMPFPWTEHFAYYASPLKLFEYMAMARPTVSSNIGEPSHIINNGEDGFLASTKEEYIEKMRKLIEDPNLRKRIGDKARETIENDYSLKVLSKRLHEILKTV